MYIQSSIYCVCVCEGGGGWGGGGGGGGGGGIHFSLTSQLLLPIS